MTEMVIVSDYAGEIFGRRVAEKLGSHYVHVDITKFSDGEVHDKVKENIRGREVFYVCPWQPNPTERFTEISLVNSTLKYSSAASIVNVPTYLGFMKKDWKDDARVPISIRTVAESIEPYADSVLTMDMHSPQIQGIFRIPLDHLDGTVLFADHISRNYDLDDIRVASPDIGGGKKAQKLAERLGLDQIAIVYKMRDPKTGEVKAKGIMGDVKGKDVILVDDQVVSGESLVEATDMLKSNGAGRIVSYCAHGVMTRKNGITAEQRIRDSAIERLYFTDTIPRPEDYFAQNEKLKLVSCIDLFAEAIRRVHNNESLSALFK